MTLPLLWVKVRFMSSNPAFPSSQSQTDGASVEMAGVVERIVFSNAKSGFIIAEIKPEKGDLFTVKGVLPGLRCGESVLVKGRLSVHPSFGPQLQAESFSVRMPASVEAMKKFLGSGLVAGVGKGFAEKIVKRFGADTARILNEESGRLREVAGVGEGRAQKIKVAWDEQRALREVLMFLQSYGVGVRRCMRIVHRYGTAAPAMLREDPYALARDVDGIGFRTADKIALNMGVGNDSERRLDAGLVFTMGEAEAEGHTALPVDELAVRCAQLLRCTEARAAARVSVLISEGNLRLYRGLVQLPGTAKAEEKAARALRAICGSASRLPAIKVAAAIDWAEARAGFAFASEQADAIAAALESPLSVITGGPGTGKTSILRALVDILRAKKVKILLASPTGRAAQRLSQSAGLPAATLHRLLRYNEAQGGERKELDADFVIVDECSMLDVRLCAALAQAVPAGAHLVMVGDSDQLPSVGAGNVLADIIDSGAASVVRLRSVFRQSEGSDIVTVAGQVLCGDVRMPAAVSVEGLARGALPECSFVEVDSPEALEEAVVTLFTRWKREGVAPLDMQLLSPMHKGRSGIQSLNSALQFALNGDSQSALEDGAGQLYRVGDKVICTRNNYDKSVFNGDMGIVTKVDSSEGALSVRFDDEELVFSRMEIVDLVPAYAISIHKSQGSEFAHVAIALMPEHMVLLRRNLLYTAITRARVNVVILGKSVAWKMAMAESRAVERFSTLCQRLRTA